MVPKVTQVADDTALSVHGAVDGLSLRQRIADVVALTKPGITINNVLTAGGGLMLAHRAGGPSGTPLEIPTSTIGYTLLGVAFVVAGANALNMYIERDIDRHMPRTKNRPLPSGRMTPRVALWVGVTLSVAAIPVLGFGVNALTALLALLANLLYVCAYTPLKQRTHYSLHVGAVPGAIPPLLGWTAATARVDTAGLVLFGILFLWQIPHFLAITLFRHEDYKRAGLVVAPNVMPIADVKHTIVRYSFALLMVSLLLYPLGVAGLGYVAAAVTLGLLFWGWGMAGFRPQAGPKWARSLFGISLVYLLLMMAALGLHI